LGCWRIQSDLARSLLDVAELLRGPARRGLLWIVYLGDGQTGKGYRYINGHASTALCSGELEAAPDDWEPHIPLDIVSTLSRLVETT
jgi:hypothetical protein